MGCVCRAMFDGSWRFTTAVGMQSKLGCVCRKDIKTVCNGMRVQGLRIDRVEYVEWDACAGDTFGGEQNGMRVQMITDARFKGLGE